MVNMFSVQKCEKPQLMTLSFPAKNTVISSILFRNYDELSHVIGMTALGCFVSIYGGIVKGVSTYTQWMGMVRTFSPLKDELVKISARM